MYWQAIYVNALLMGLFGSTTTTDAFSLSTTKTSFVLPRPNQAVTWNDVLTTTETTPSIKKTTTVCMSGPGDDLDLDSAETDGAELTPEMVAKMKASHTEEEDASQGGSMFRKMMERAKSSQTIKPTSPPPPPPPITEPTQAADPSLAGTVSSLSVEEQARLFRQMMEQQPQQQTQAPVADVVPPRAPPQMQGGVGADGRRIGRNKDADAIVNSADVYFAQLKRDSSVRGMQRINGEFDKSNQVFADPKIKQIMIPENPYLEAKKKKEEEERAKMENVPTEYIDPAFFISEPEVDKSYSGVSYKQKLLARRKGGNKPSPGQQQASSTQTVQPIQNPPPAEAIQSPVVSPAVQEEIPQSPPQPPPTPQEAIPPPAQTAEVGQVKKPTVEGTGEDDKRTDIRTLMGLLIKHRGGPGFGSGRLQGSEVQRFEGLAGDVLGMLREEAMDSGNTGNYGKDLTVQEETPPLQQQHQQPMDVRPPSPVTPPPAVAVTPPPVPAPVTPPPPPPPAPATTPTSNSPVTDDVICGMISYIDGAYQMYCNSPAELREMTLLTVRSALETAVTKCDEIIASGQVPTVTAAAAGTTTGIRTTSTPSPDDNIAGIMSYLDGAYQMYRNSPPELRGNTLVMVRSALVTAASKCSEGEGGGEDTTAVMESPPETVQDTTTTTSSVSQTAPPPPQTSTVGAGESPEVVVQDDMSGASSQTTTPETSSTMGVGDAASTTPVCPMGNSIQTPNTDPHSIQLESLYDKLTKAAGNGTMGIRSDITSEDAMDLADELQDMVPILMNELENGIPEAEVVVEEEKAAELDIIAEEERSESGPEPISVSLSRYEEMLAKVKKSQES